MKGFLGRIGARSPRITPATRTLLLAEALRMHGHGTRAMVIEEHLLARGLDQVEAAAVCAEARTQFDAEAARTVALPATARGPINYYFALGVTPRASSDRIHRAYRLRAREVHPDRHQNDLDHERWGHLMTVVADAHAVLLEESTRQAYDVLWLRRSRRATLQNATPRERRGDWDTRYQWYMAEVAEIEDNVQDVTEDLAARLQVGAPLDEALYALGPVVDLYEERILDVRTGALTVPAAHRAFADRARIELGRKDRLVAILRAIETDLPWGEYSAGQRATALERVATAASTRSDVRSAHRRFELETLRQLVS